MAKVIRSIAAAVFLASHTLGAQGQTYPVKPIRAILGLGGAGEAIARLIGQKMSEGLGQPVLIEPQPAAAGSIASSTVARSASDGYTILHTATHSHVYRIFLAKNVSYDPIRDFTPIAMLSEAIPVYAVSVSSGITDIKDLVERARQAPEKLFYGTSGVGTTHHLSGELLQGLTGIKMSHVPYKDPNQVVTELIAGRIPTGWGLFGAMYMHHVAGKLRIIAVNTTTRYIRMPNIPTVGEQVPGYEPPPGWNAWFGPAGVPRPIVQRLNSEITKAIVSPDLKDKIDALGFIPTPSSPEALAAELKRSIERAGKLIKAVGVEPE